jgi:hypothetical protein
MLKEEVVDVPQKFVKAVEKLITLICTQQRA